MNVREELFKLKDEKYRNFNIKLIPTVDENTVIGIRVPELRKLVKKLENNDFPWDYYEEKMLHGFYIGIKNMPYKDRLELVEEFVPQIDNWAVCDSACSSMKFVNNNKAQFFEFLKKYMYSNDEYSLRFACVILMDYYIDYEYIDVVLDYYSNVNSDYYYVNMAVAWGLSVAFVKYHQNVLKILESKILSRDVHNMTISKIRDSYRVSPEIKTYIKTLRV